MVGLAGYWFIFYKLENRAYVLLPLGYWRPIYRNFDILFGLLASAKLIVIFLKMASQTSYDVFFIDWEKPKKDPKNPKANDNINVWRTIITANEMNELQNTPLVTIEFTYLVYIFFMLYTFVFVYIFLADLDGTTGLSKVLLLQSAPTIVPLIESSSSLYSHLSSCAPELQSSSSESF